MINYIKIGSNTVIECNSKILLSDGERVSFQIYGSTSFDPAVINAVSNGIWDFGDGTSVEENVPNAHVYADNNIYNVSYISRDLNKVTVLGSDNDSIIGTMYLAKLKGLTALNLSNNYITNIVNPTTSSNIITYIVARNNISGTLNLSMLLNLGGNLQFNNNPNLTSIILPSNSKTVSYFFAYSCDLGYIDFTVMPNMTSVNDCDILLYDNAMTAAEVNHILVDLNSISTAGYTGRVISIGGTNADPDSSSGGYNGLEAITSLESKGFTVTLT